MGENLKSKPEDRRSRCPLRHHLSVRNIHRAESLDGLGGCLRQSRIGGDHGIQQRQRQRRTHPAQECSASHRLFGIEH
jgi:hypothetical protein